MMRVLFLCTGNSCRSQMAEGFLKKIGKKRFEAYSAGTFPKNKVHPLAIECMKEVGIDISHQQPKSLDPIWFEKWDYVITVCDRAKESCPRMAAANRTLHWSFDDPAEAEGSEKEKKKVFCRVRDEIKSEINNFVQSLVPELK